MLALFANLLDTSDFPQRWYCGNWSEFHGWVHVVSDVAIFAAYFSIPAIILWFARKRADLTGSPLIYLSAAFIFSCGLGHLIEASIFWHPWYRLSGAVKALTAAISWATVIVLARELPTLLRLPKLAHVNEDLEREVAERRQAQAALEASEARFRALVDSSAQIVWTTNGAGAVVEDSPSWRAFTGQTFEQWIGSGFLDAIHPDDRDRVFASWTAAVANVEPLHIDYRLRHHTGVWRWTTVRTTPLYGPDGEVTEWVGMNTDIHERHVVEDERERLMEELETRVEERTAELAAALEEREVLLKEVHHRVKNNLQVVSSLIRLQTRTMGDSPGRAALQECQARVEAIAIVHGHLYQSLDFASVPLNDYLETLLRGVVRSSGSRAFELVTDLEDIRLTVDQAIPCGLIVNELVTNAIKHAFDGRQRGTISVTAVSCGPERVRITVSDDGTGLPPDFDISASSSLGLELVVTLSEQLHATLEVGADDGAVFAIEFPTSGEVE